MKHHSTGIENKHGSFDCVEWFKTQAEAWAFAGMLPKVRYTVTDYGEEDGEFYIKFVDTPAYRRATLQPIGRK